MPKLSRAKIALVALCTCVPFLVACPGDSGTTAVPEAASLELVDGDGQEGTVGDVLGAPLRVRVVDQSGKPMAGATVSWAVVSGGGSIASTSVTGDDGVAGTAWQLGTAAGEQWARASIGSLGPIDFAAGAMPGPAATMTIVPGDLFLQALGDTARLSIEAEDAYGNPTPPSGAAWSATTGAVSVAGGLVRAVANGTAQVTASLGSASAAVEVVVHQASHALVVQPVAPLESLGDSVQLVAEVRDRNGNPVVDALVHWATLDSAVLHVEMDGVATALMRGEARVVAASAGMTDTVLVQVSPAAATLAVTAAPELTFGSETTATATAYDRRGNVIHDAAIEWTTTDAGTASIDSTGSISGTGAGTAWVRAASGNAADSVMVTVLSRRLEFTPPADAVGTHAMVTLRAPAGAPLPDTVTGFVGGAEILLAATGDSALAGVVPAIAAGSHDLTVQLDRNHLGVSRLTVFESAPVADPAVVVDEALATLDELAASRADSAAPGAVPAADGLATLLRQQLATASAEERREFAEFWRANAGTLGLSTPVSASSGVSLVDCDQDYGDTPPVVLVYCNAEASQAVALAGAATVVAGVLCVVEPSKLLCLGVMSLAVERIVRADTKVRSALDQIGIAVDNMPFDAVLYDTDAFPVRVPFGVAPATLSTDTLEFEAGRARRLEADATFRSMVAADEGLHSGLAVGIAAVRTLDAMWDVAASALEAVRSLFSSVPALGAGPGDPPTTPLTRAEHSIPEVELSIGEVTGPVTVLYDPATGTIVVDSDEGGITEFTFGLVYRHLFGEVTTVFPGRVEKPDLELLHSDSVPLNDTTVFVHARERRFVLRSAGTDTIDYSLVTLGGNTNAEVTVGVTVDPLAPDSFAITMRSDGADTTTVDVFYDGQLVDSVHAKLEGFRIADHLLRVVQDSVAFMNGRPSAFLLVNADGTPAEDVDYSRLRVANVSHSQVAVTLTPGPDGFELTLGSELEDAVTAIDVLLGDRLVQRIDAKLATYQVAYANGPIIGSADTVKFELEQMRHFRLVHPDGTPADIDYTFFDVEVRHDANPAVVRTLQLLPDSFGIALEANREQYTTLDVLYKGRLIQTVQARLLGLVIASPDGTILGMPVRMSSGVRRDFTLVNTDGTPVDFVTYTDVAFWVSDSTNTHSVDNQRSATGFSVLLDDPSGTLTKFNLHWRGRVVQEVQAAVGIQIIVPRDAVVEIGQTLQYYAQLDATLWGLPVTWATTGGTITSDGLFTPSAPSGVMEVSASVDYEGETLTDRVTVDVLAPIRQASGLGVYAHDLNNALEVVGGFHRADGSAGAFHWANGVLTELEGGSAAWAINDAGTIVGQGTGGAVIWRNGVREALVDSACAPNVAHGISNAGHVVGTCGNGGMGFVWYEGTFTLFDGDPTNAYGGQTMPLAVNDSGQVVGQTAWPDSTWGPFMYDPSTGVMVALTSSPGAATHINNAGTVLLLLGQSVFPGEGQAESFATWNAGIVTPIADVTKATGLNELGDVVGSRVSEAGLLVGYVWRDGRLTGTTHYELRDINDDGRLVGWSALR